MIKKISTHLKVINILADWTITPARFLIPLMLVAALMNAYLFIRNPNIGGDALLYHAAFHNFMAGKGWVYFIYGSYIWAPVEPGYGMLSYLFYLLVSDIELSGMVVSTIAYLLMILVVYYTVDYLFGKRSALLAACLITFWPTLISYSYTNLTDCTFVFFLFVGFSLYTRVALNENRLSRSALLGLFLGLGYLIREGEGLLVAILAILSLFALAVYYQQQTKKTLGLQLKLFLFPITTLLVFMVVAFPYILIIHTYTGVWTPTTKIMPVFKTIPMPSNTESTSESPTSATFQDESGISSIGETQFVGLKIVQSPSFANIGKNISGLIVYLLTMNAHALATLTLLWGIFPLLSTKKLFTRLRPGARKIRILLSLAVFSSPALLHLAIPERLDSRLLMQYSIYLLIGIAFLCIRFLEKIQTSWGRQYSDAWVILICLVSIVASLGFGSPTLIDALTETHGHLGLRSAGLWLSEHAQNPEALSIIATRKGEVALFYASNKTFSVGRSQDLTSDMTLEQIGDLMSARAIDYLLLDNHYVNDLPNLMPLWENPTLARYFGLSLVYRDDDDLFQIYSVIKPPDSEGRSARVLCACLFAC